MLLLLLLLVVVVVAGFGAIISGGFSVLSSLVLLLLLSVVDEAEEEGEADELELDEDGNRTGVSPMAGKFWCEDMFGTSWGTMGAGVGFSAFVSFRRLNPKRRGPPLGLSPFSLLLLPLYSVVLGAPLLLLLCCLLL